MIDEIKNDQQEKKRQLTNALHYFKDLKDKELDRQLKENAEIARDTEKENKQFTEIFLDSSYRTEEQLDPKFIFDFDPAPAAGIYGKVQPLPNNKPNVRYYKYVSNEGVCELQLVERWCIRCHDRSRTLTHSLKIHVS